MTARSFRKRFVHCCCAAAIIEMALIAPVFVSIFMGLVEYSNYNNLKRRTYMAADAMALMLAQYGNQPLTAAERDNLINLWYVINPTASAGRGGNALPENLAVGMASYTFEDHPTCTARLCKEPQVEWRFAAANGITNAGLRDCDVIVVQNNQDTDADELPQGIIWDNPVVGVELVFRHQPLFASFLGESLIKVRTFQSTRDGVPLQHRDPASPSFKECPA